MVIFHSYVSLPEGTFMICGSTICGYCWCNQNKSLQHETGTFTRLPWKCLSWLKGISPMPRTGMWNECCIYVACFFHFGKWQKPQQTFTFARMAMQRTFFFNLDIELNRGRVASNEQRMFCSPQLMGATPDHTDHVLVVRFWQPAGLRTVRKLQRGKGYCSWMLISY